jgi:hypothetical protein
LDQDPDWIRIRIGSGSGLDQDPDWIRIRIGSGFYVIPGFGFAIWIRFRIHEAKSDPKIEKS